jgi:hypothetical protein
LALGIDTVRIKIWAFLAHACLMRHHWFPSGRRQQAATTGGHVDGVDQ